MRKSFTILMALVIAFFTVPFGGITALADSEDKKQIEYEIMHENGEATSVADNFFLKPGLLFEKGGKKYVEIAITSGDMVRDLGSVHGKAEVIKKNEDGSILVQLPVNDDLSETEIDMHVVVPGLYDQEHEALFVIKSVEESDDNKDDGKEENGEDQEETDQPGTPEDSNENDDNEGSEEESGEDNESGSEDGSEEDNDSNGSENESGDNEESLIEITDADESYEMEFLTDSSSTKRQFNNPVTLLIKDGKKYIQMNGTGGQFITSLTVNGSEVTWGDKDDEGNFIVQFELPGAPSDELDFGMTIDTGNPQFGEMTHNVSLSFGNRVDLNEPIGVSSGEKILVDDTVLTMPENLPEDAKVTIISKEKVENKGDLDIAGKVYEFNFEGIDDFEGSFELVMTYDQENFNSDDYEVDIYYYDEEKGEWIPQGGTVEGDEISVSVTHFSSYGVFAKEVESSEDPDETDDTKTPTKPIEVPEDAKKVDYTILHENGKDKSTANSFFVKPGLLFEHDGKQYVEVTITNGDMVRGLSTFDTDAVIVKENTDSSIVVQFQVNSDLSDTILDMRIVVPGMYDTEHSALFSFNDEGTPGEPGKPKEDPKKETKPTPVTTEKPDNAYEINYEIVNENKTDTSAADQFFEKPALLLVKDGKTYMQVTINNGDMVEGLSTEYGEAVIIKTNSDGSIVVQFLVNNDLSDTLLNMTINVPGLYKSDYKTYIVFDQDSKVEVDVGDNKIVTPEKPSFGNGDKDNDENGEKGKKNGDDNNPQTGDTTSLIMYSLLLIGSLIPLAVKFRRRFI